IRALPGDDPQRYVDTFAAHCRDVVLPRIRKIAPGCDIESLPRAGTPALNPEPQSEAERLCRMLTGDNDTRHVSYAAEAGLFQKGGLSTVICGPGSIAQAHQPNEFITLEQIAAGTKFIGDLITHLSR
ncbi:MAG: M20/M25/M40 family metallo-hydrolase, partial [Rhodobacteraceae bacterium]|nr:M20/M25/M40 family metallo-hydrolase [Paracoccaceae bacterium]